MTQAQAALHSPARQGSPGTSPSTAPATSSAPSPPAWAVPSASPSPPCGRPQTPCPTAPAPAAPWCVPRQLCNSPPWMSPSPHTTAPASCPPRGTSPPRWPPSRRGCPQSRGRHRPACGAQTPSATRPRAWWHQSPAQSSARQTHSPMARPHTPDPCLLCVRLCHRQTARCSTSQTQPGRRPGLDRPSACFQPPPRLHSPACESPSALAATYVRCTAPSPARDTSCRPAWSARRSPPSARASARRR